MNPLIRFHSVVLAITTIIVFYAWKYIPDISESLTGWITPVEAIATIGVYRIVMSFVKQIFLKVRCVKKLVFGSYYLEGVWVGFFIGSNNNVRYYIETYEQNFDSVVIRGKGFSEPEGCFGEWTTESTNINIKKGTLDYTYFTDMFNNTFINSGLAHFTFERETMHKAPHKMYGFSSDLYSPKKYKSFEIKISDKPHIVNEIEYLNLAMEYYQNNLHLIQMQQ